MVRAPVKPPLSEEELRGYDREKMTELSDQRVGELNNISHSAVYKLERIWLCILALA